MQRDLTYHKPVDVTSTLHTFFTRTYFTAVEHTKVNEGALQIGKK